MSNKQFAAGDTVYDIEGQAFAYIGPCGAGHAVEALYEQDEEGPYYAEPQSLLQVFAEPPRRKLSEDLSELHQLIKDRRAELSSINSEILQAQQEKRAVLARAKSDPQLADLHLWLEGKATHIVVLDAYRIEVGTVKDILMSTDGYDRKLRLLSLFVDPHANRYWVGRCSYSDGGGSQTRCMLASSEEHAKQLAREYIVQQLQDSQYRNDASWIRIALEYGVPVTDAQQKVLSVQKSKVAAERLEQAQREFARAEANLRTAQAQVKEAACETT